MTPTYHLIGVCIQVLLRSVAELWSQALALLASHAYARWCPCTLQLHWAKTTSWVENHVGLAARSGSSSSHAGLKTTQGVENRAWGVYSSW